MCSKIKRFEFASKKSTTVTYFFVIEYVLKCMSHPVGFWWLIKYNAICDSDELSKYAALYLAQFP